MEHDRKGGSRNELRKCKMKKKKKGSFNKITLFKNYMMKNVGHIMSKYTNNNMAADTENKAFHGTGQGK